MVRSTKIRQFYLLVIKEIDFLVLVLDIHYSFVLLITHVEFIQKLLGLVVRLLLTSV